MGPFKQELWPSSPRWAATRRPCSPQALLQMLSFKRSLSLFKVNYLCKYKSSKGKKACNLFWQPSGGVGVCVCVAGNCKGCSMMNQSSIRLTFVRFCLRFSSNFSQGTACAWECDIWLNSDQTALSLAVDSVWDCHVRLFCDKFSNYLEITWDWTAIYSDSSKLLKIVFEANRLIASFISSPCWLEHHLHKIIYDLWILFIMNIEYIYIYQCQSGRTYSAAEIKALKRRGLKQYCLSKFTIYPAIY